MKLKYNVNCVMPARCLHRKWSQFRNRCYYEKNILEKKERSLKLNKQKIYFPSSHGTLSPFSSTLEITA